MPFFLAILVLLHGAFGLVVAKIRLNTFYELLPNSLADTLAKIWPYNVYKVELSAPDAAAPSANQSYAICAAEMAGAVWFLHRGQKTARRA
jgi:hypothetical protein